MATSEQPPAPQPVQQASQGPPPLLQEGYIQLCQGGYLKRRSTILKRWKKAWYSVTPGEPPLRPTTPTAFVNYFFERCSVLREYKMCFNQINVMYSVANWSDFMKTLLSQIFLSITCTLKLMNTFVKICSKLVLLK